MYLYMYMNYILNNKNRRRSMSKIWKMWNAITNIRQTNIQIVKFNTKVYSKIISNLNSKIDQKTPHSCFYSKIHISGLYIWIVLSRN